jgi:CHAT domain-containing protein
VRLFGFTRGLLYAGASSVVASLWKVNDQATAELMAAFYQGLVINRLAPAVALRRAQLRVRDDPRWSAPFFWSGFVLVGDGQALAGGL